MKLVAFDLETSLDLTEENIAPPLACAAVWIEGESNARFFYSAEEDGPAVEMSKGDAVALVHFLLGRTRSGDVVVTWNGAAFDFRLLASASGLHKECVEVARNHVDLMFLVVCARGHFLSLDKAARGFGLDGKSEEATGKEVPALWRSGETAQVLRYLAQDVRTTLDVALRVRETRKLRWLNSKGKKNQIPVEFLTVEEALRMPRPQAPEWLKNPVRREDLLAWIIKDEEKTI
jgi:hypothetical protein